MRGSKICVVDHDTSLLCSLGRLLASDDLDAEAFDNPEKFLDYVRAHAVRVAIVDVCMPAQNAIEVQDRLHRLSPETRVIMMTGRDEPAIRTLALSRGVFAFLTEALDHGALLASVPGHSRSKRLSLSATLFIRPRNCYAVSR